MMREATMSANTEVQTAVEQLLIEDARFDELERRSLHRQMLVRPITVVSREGGETVGGISRNISALGVCVLTRKPMTEGSIARICVHCLDSEPKVFLSECRWNRKFGNGWNMSGWHFINMQ